MSDVIFECNYERNLMDFSYDETPAKTGSSFRPPNYLYKPDAKLYKTVSQIIFRYILEPNLIQAEPYHIGEGRVILAIDLLNIFYAEYNKVNSPEPYQTRIIDRLKTTFISLNQIGISFRPVFFVDRGYNPEKLTRSDDPKVDEFCKQLKDMYGLGGQITNPYDGNIDLHSFIFCNGHDAEEMMILHTMNRNTIFMSDDVDTLFHMSIHHTTPKICIRSTGAVIINPSCFHDVHSRVNNIISSMRLTPRLKHQYLDRLLDSFNTRMDTS